MTKRLTSLRILAPMFLQIGGFLSPDDGAMGAAFILPPQKVRCLIAPCAVFHAHDTEIPIIYENDKLLAIIKPPHIPHHDDQSTGQLGILSMIRAQQQQSKSPFPYPDRLYGVHRLDRVTSGILLLAKDSSTASMLMNKFRRKEITKYYIAISGKKPKKKKQGWVKGMMTLGRRGSYKLVNDSNKLKSSANEEGGETDLGDSDDVDSSRGKDQNDKKNKGYAVTRFFTAGLGNLQLAPSLLATLKDNNGNGDQPVPKTAILFQPQTGKTHQLRVAAKSLGMPILGDIRYGGGRICGSNTDSIDEGDIDNFDRTYLHASALHFQMDENESVTIWSPPPFGHLFSSSELNDIFVSMMRKHCDCPQIIDAIQSAADQSNTL